MQAKTRFLKVIVLSVFILAGLSCNLMRSIEGTPTTETEPALAETEIALRVMATSLANEQATLQAAQAEMTARSADQAPGPTSEPPPQPTVQVLSPTAVPTQTSVPTPLPLVLEIRTSVNTFYCYQSPYELTITVKVSDISRGMAVYYHIQDKKTGVTSDWQSLDLRRKSGDTRSATIIGGGSMDQNLQFPALMGESYFIYQIVSDDNSYRSQSFSNVTFFPCAQ